MGRNKLKCERCRVVNDTVVRYRQRTMYHDDESNYATLCGECSEENDEYWDDMWADYYRGCM